ncbi:unnamed protein product [Orchesella dallaii]|uniref:MACPF domain-containing protein n=1 Tax=Orchesella dallaii TaxID=48710 RepID=A0ABP1RZU0_9HEXA
MFSQYKRLPDNYLEDPLAYYHFINSYGTGIITSTTFGGRFQVLVTSDRLKHDILNTDLTDKASLEGVLNQVINTDSEASRVTMLVEGGGFPASTSRKDIAQWQKMVMDAPVSLFPNVLPIYKFLELDSSVRTGRYEGLRQTVQYEQEIQNIRKVLYALDMVKTSRLSIFLKNILYEEVQRVCPSSQVSNIIKKGILDYNNLNLAKFSLRCNHKREYSEYHKEDVKRAHLFKLLPGICFTVTEKLETCEFSRMTLPPEVRCINFYKENHCHGAVGKLVTNFDDLNQAFNAGLKSFAFCE